MANKIKNLLLVSRVWLDFFIRGSARRGAADPASVLVFQGAKMGDMVCTTPVFRAIKKIYPDCRLTVVGDKTNRLLLANHPDVDHYIVWERSSTRLRNELSGRHFDFACLATPSFDALAALFLSGVSALVAPRVVGGWCPFQTWSYRLLLPLVISIPHRFNHYAPREYLNLLLPLGIKTDDTAKHLKYSPTAAEKIKTFFENNCLNPQRDFIVGISPSAGNKVKNWGGSKFAELANYLYDKYKYPIVIIGGPRDRTEVEEMVACLNSATHVINTLDLFSLDDLQALVAQLRLFISVDTGPIYIAEAFNVPTVDILGPMNALEQPPRGDWHLNVSPPEPRVPQLHILNASVYDKVEAERQTAAITVDMVRKTVDELIKKINDAGHTN